MKTIHIASDHAGFAMKKDLIHSFLLKHEQIEVIDYGTNNFDSTDYPDYVEKLAKMVLVNETINLGILICSTGVGMTIAANKIKNIRAALVNNPNYAEFVIKHNNANVICLSGHFTSFTDNKKIIEIVLGSHFEGGRHARRICKINELEN